MIEIRKLTKKYGAQTAVDRIELRFDRGIYALLGPNGAGKTTFLNMLMRLSQNSERGSLFIAGISQKY